MLAGAALTARAAEPAPTIAARTAGLECQPGFVPICWDASEGKLLMEVSRFGEEFLYLTYLATGVGANELGLDRGVPLQGEGGPHSSLVRFERVGPRVLLVLTNTRYRAQTQSEALPQGVAEQFPVSVLRGWKIEAEEGGRVLVDATQFFLGDAAGVAARLKQQKQGDWKLDVEDRSVIFLPRTKAFPRNTEVEVLLTFASDNPGPLVRWTAPDGRSLTLRVHHSLVALPETPYRPRRFDPRVGGLPLEFNDYAQPLDGRLTQRNILRWRLERPAGAPAGLAEPVQSIAYYLDPAMPEPIRSAVREGALWWNGVFEAAGFKNAFQVRDLPAGADAMDIRYSIIQWGHRADRGWSWGDNVADPRTGEILKAVVFMDSHRMRTDYNLWAGLESPETGSGNECYAGAWGVPDWVADLDPKTSAEALVLARARQLGAHEVGHTLGLAHNFAASTYGRASVMDYPAPLVKLSDGEVDLSEAYEPGPGAYDRFAIQYMYTPFAPGEEEAGLKRIIEDGLRRGMLFLSDADTRPAGASDPRANLWDNYSDPATDFRRAVEVREALLEKFSAAALKEGEPLGLLEERLAPVYFHHQFALAGLVKVIGGMEYVYAVQGDGQEATRLIDPVRQREALELLQEALQPEALALPEEVVAQLAPPAFGYEKNPSYAFRSQTAPAFDELGAARSLATMIVDGALNRERAARLVAFAGRQEEPLTLVGVVESLLDATWHQRWEADERLAALQGVAQRAVLDRLLALAADEKATPEVRAVAEWALADLVDDIKDQENPNPLGEAVRQLAERDITRFLNRTAEETEPSKALEAPLGSPIGE